MKTYDAVVVGSGPNGLAAAITIARAGRSVLVLEAAASCGGGVRSEAATLPGFVHDVCSAIHPMAVTSPFFQSLPLEKWGVEWVYSPAALAHPLEGEEAVLLETSIEGTAANLGEDKASYIQIMRPLAENWQELFQDILQPVPRWPRHPWLTARFGIKALLSAESFARRSFGSTRARALFAGIAAHANAPLHQAGTAAIGLMLNLAAHARGWPLPRGGSQRIAEALATGLRSFGGELRLEHPVHSLRDLPPSRCVLFDLTPRQILSILGERLTPRQAASLFKFQYGPGVFKMDWALSRPIPWKSANCLRAATVHLGGTLEEMAASESAPARGRCPERPYVLLSQPSLFDPTRAPAGRHTAWAYCHVPHGSRESQVLAIEEQIERFAPGFRDCVLARRSLTTADLEAKNANLVGGDIAGGAVFLRQLLFRPVLKINPYRLPLPGFYICSASTPPGPGVHGMCGWNAARRALEDLA